jgi:hypothetical protein
MIQKKIDEVSESVEALRQQINELGKQLSPVCVPVPAVAAASELRSTDPQSPLEEKLASLKMSVITCIVNVESLKSTLRL